MTKSLRAFECCSAAGVHLLAPWIMMAHILNPTGWGPLVISRVIRALNWVIRTLS